MTLGRNRAAIGAALLGLAGLGAGAALAQEEDSTRFRVQALGLVQAEANGDAGGNVSSKRWLIQPSVSISPTPVHGATLSVGIGETSYDFSGLGPDRDVDLRDFTLSAPVRMPLGGNTLALIVPVFATHGESGAALKDTSSYGVIGSINWRLASGLTLGPGVGAVKTIRDDTKLFPFLYLNWQVNDSLRLRTGDALPGARGPSLAVEFSPIDTWTYSLIGQSSRYEARLDTGSIASGGTVEDRSEQLILAAKWQPFPEAALSAFAGWAFDGEIVTRDSHGDVVARDGYGTAPILGVSVDLRF